MTSITALLAALLAASPYVLVLRDGSAVRLTEAPTSKNTLLVATLEDGTVVSLPAARVDWEATRRANRPRPEPPAAAAEIDVDERARRSPRNTRVIDNRTIGHFVERSPGFTTVPVTDRPGAVTKAAPRPPTAAPEVPVTLTSRLDRDGNGPAYWRDRARRLRQDGREAELAVATAEGNLKRERDAFLHGRRYRSSGIDITQPYQSAEERASAQDRISLWEVRLADARLQLDFARGRFDDLCEEARRAGAPPGWLRPDAARW